MIRNCRAIFIFCFLVNAKNHLFAQAILPPSQPKKRPPVYDQETNLERLKQNQKEKKQQEQTPALKSPESSDFNRINPPPASVVKKKDSITVIYDHVLALSLSLSSVKASSSKNTYSSEPNSHFLYMRRMSDSKNNLKEQTVWLGVRLANMSGTATLDDINARYSFTYMGPVFGFGKIFYPEEKPFSRIEKDEPADSYSDTKQPINGYFFLSGLAGSVKKIDIDPSINNPPKDFQTTKSISFAEPHFWIEGVYMDFHKEQHLATHYSVGLQKGVGKIWFWASLAVGGWL